VTTIPTRTLGRTRVEVSTLAYGSLELYGPVFRGQPGITAEEADAILKALLDSGVNYVDTAPDYGESESYLGQYLSDHRDEWFIASKCGCVIDTEDTVVAAGDPLPVHDYHPATIIAGVEQSLRRLRTDHLDLVQVHINPSRAVLESTGAIETLVDLQRQGKTRFIGCSSGFPHLKDHIEMGVFDVFQLPYSGIDREHENAISDAARSGAGVIIRGSFGPDRASATFRPKRRDWSVLESPEFINLRDGISPYEFMLRFTLSHPDVTAAIVGTKRPAELAANIAAARRGPLSSDAYSEAKRLFAQLGSIPE
jgi:aryl-alcohol dehydrogenase-like predicted oxidoreductase